MLVFLRVVFCWVFFAGVGGGGGGKGVLYVCRIRITIQSNVCCFRFQFNNEQNNLVLKSKCIIHSVWECIMFCIMFLHLHLSKYRSVMDVTVVDVVGFK